jgi:hypothetical protein
LKIEQAPELRGFKLGQTLKDTKARFPSIRFVTAREDGYSTEILDGYDLRESDKSQFSGLRSIWASFLDGKLASIDFRYDDSVKWNSVTEFTDRVSETLKLPKVWSSENSFTNHLDCDGFFLEAMAHSGLETRLRVRRSDLDGILEKRKQTAEEKRRQDFNP